MGGWDCKTIHRIKKKDWDLRGQRSKTNERVNRDILQISQRLYEIHDQFYYQRKVVTMTAIRAEFMGDGNNIPLIAYLNKHLKWLEKSPNHAKGTVENWKVRGNRLIEFLEKHKLQGITLQEIEAKLLKKYDDWLSVQISDQYKRPFKRSYINEHHRRFSALLNKVAKEQIIDKNPYLHFKMDKDNKKVQ